MTKRTRQQTQVQRNLSKIVKKSETNLWRLAFGGQTVKNLHSLACKFDLDQSERKSSQVIQVHESHGQTESQINARFQLVITSDSVWPGRKDEGKTNKLAN